MKWLGWGEQGLEKSKGQHCCVTELGAEHTKAHAWSGKGKGLVCGSVRVTDMERVALKHPCCELEHGRKKMNASFIWCPKAAVFGSVGSARAGGTVAHWHGTAVSVNAVVCISWGHRTKRTCLLASVSRARKRAVIYPPPSERDAYAKRK